MAKSSAVVEKPKVKEVKAVEPVKAKVAVFEKDGKKFPTIELRRGSDKFGFTFGLSKARMIVEAMNEIETFVDENDDTSALKVR